MIYFIQEEDGQDHFVKIGWSETPDNLSDLYRFRGRMHCLQVGNARYLDVLAVIKGTEADEDMVHEKFKEAKVPTKGRGERVTDRGEWFYPVEELMDLINRLPKYPDPEALADERGDEYLEYIASLLPYKNPYLLSPEEQRLIGARLAAPMTFGRKLA